jgi:hypothetical protein
VHAVKKYGGGGGSRGGIVPFIRKRGIRFRLMVNSRPGCFTPGKETRYRMNKRLDGPQSRSERNGEEKNLSPLPGFETPIAQRVT